MLCERDAVSCCGGDWVPDANGAIQTASNQQSASVHGCVEARQKMQVLFVD